MSLVWAPQKAEVRVMLSYETEWDPTPGQQCKNMKTKELSGEQLVSD